jgi:hypothetical protein
VGGRKQVRSHPTLKRIYREYNRKYFGGRLPNVDINFISPGQMKKCFGLARATCAVTCFKKGTITPVAIYISKNKYKIWRYVRADLLHELVHVDRPRADHGPVFENEMKRLAAAGAFKGIW